MITYRIMYLDPGYRVEIYKYISIFGCKIGVWLWDEGYRNIKEAKHYINYLKNKKYKQRHRTLVYEE